MRGHLHLHGVQPLHKTRKTGGLQLNCQVVVSGHAFLPTVHNNTRQKRCQIHLADHICCGSNQQHTSTHDNAVRADTANMHQQKRALAPHAKDSHMPGWGQACRVQISLLYTAHWMQNTEQQCHVTMAYNHGTSCQRFYSLDLFAGRPDSRCKAPPTAFTVAGLVICANPSGPASHFNAYSNHAMP